MTIKSGSQLGPYEILEPIGAGGMGEVYRAKDPRLERDVAIKVLPEGFATDPDRMRRFEKEAKAAGALDYPNILNVHDIGNEGCLPYVVSEPLEDERTNRWTCACALSIRKAIRPQNRKVFTDEKVPPSFAGAHTLLAVPPPAPRRPGGSCSTRRSWPIQ